MKRILWMVLPYALVAAVVGPQALARFEPAENWFRVAGITVPDAEVGRPIYMSVTRTILQPFVGQWVATVRRLTDGGLEMACKATGTAAYRPEAALPKPLTLDWWTYPVQCSLTPGKYRLDTVWVFEVGWGVTKTVTADSNIFEVR